MTGDGPLPRSFTLMTNEPLIPDRIQGIESPLTIKDLTSKKDDYETRLEGCGKPWKNMKPDVAYVRFPSYRLIRHKFELLEALLEIKYYAWLDLHFFRLEVINRHGFDFDFVAFQQATLQILYQLNLLKRAEDAGIIGRKSRKD